MKVLVHDNVDELRHSRSPYVTAQVGETLERFAATIHQVDVTLSREGQHAAEVTHCHIVARLGSLGDAVADCREPNDHSALKGALERLVRGLTKRVEKSRDAQEVIAGSVLS